VIQQEEYSNFSESSLAFLHYCRDLFLARGSGVIQESLHFRQSWHGGLRTGSSDRNRRSGENGTAAHRLSLNSRKFASRRGIKHQRDIMSLRKLREIFHRL
jgi:hypothetical protein